jgi:UDP-glucose 4-epimerase
MTHAPLDLLLTGGAGYVGSHAAEALLQAGHRVWVVDDLSTGHRAAVPPAAHFVEGDLGDASVRAGLFAARRYDAVLHFAGRIDPGASMADPASYFAHNTALSLSLAQAAAAAGVGRFVFSSTAAIYGAPTEAPLSEGHPKQPTTPYGHAKWMVEQALDWIAPAHGMQCISLRYFNAAGATAARGEDHRPETHLIPRLLAVAAGALPEITLHGDDHPTRDGTGIRDYVHVADLADAHRRAVEAALPGPRHAFNLGAGRGHSTLEVLRAAVAVTGRPIPARFGPRRPGDPPALVADTTHAQATLGWAPHRSALTDILASAWDWVRAHPDGYGP